MTRPLSIDEGSELAEYLDHVVHESSDRYAKAITPALFALVHVHEVRRGVWAGWCDPGYDYGDPVARDVGRWLRERFK